MSDVLKKALHLIVGAPLGSKAGRSLSKLSERELIRLESEIGRELFGPVPAGHRREFFCLDEQTWIWHEEWTDPRTKLLRQITTRYEVHPNGILKVQDGQQYRFIDGEELHNLGVATALYRERVLRRIYNRDPHTGRPLATVPDTIRAA